MTATTAPSIDQLELARGGHTNRTTGVCFMEAVAWYAGEGHSAQPACVSPFLRSFGISLNDRLPNDKRQLLKPFIFDVIGTADDGLDDKRREMVRQWLMGDALPKWLELANLPELAQKARDGAGLSGRELERAIYEIRNLTWDARSARYDTLRAKVRAAVEERLKAEGKPVAVAAAAAAAVADAAAVAAAAAAAVAAAVADAVADADAAAAAAAAAAAVAAADADAVADADADAVADAAADAVAVAVAVAAAAAVAAADYSYGTDDYWQLRNAVYNAVKAKIDEATEGRLAQIRELGEQQAVECLGLYERIAKLRPAV